MAWAFAILGHEASTFFSSIEAGINRFVENASMRDLTNVCFAVAVADQIEKSEHVLRTLWDRAMQLIPTDVTNLDDEQICQLAQAKIFADAYVVELPVCPDMLKRLADAMKALHGVNNKLSKCSTRVSKCLKNIGFEHECEVPPSSDFWGGFMAIDFASKDRKVAIEFDGPSHFLNAIGSGKLTTQRNGTTQAKRRLLERLGWTVISLNFREFDRARREFDYLRSEFCREGVELLLL